MKDKIITAIFGAILLMLGCLLMISAGYRSVRFLVADLRFFSDGVDAQAEIVSSEGLGFSRVFTAASTRVTFTCRDDAGGSHSAESNLVGPFRQGQNWRFSTWRATH